MKDILVDNCLASHFANPVQQEYKEFIRWLFHDGSLVVTQQLIKEYIATAGGSPIPTCLHAIVDFQTKAGRINRLKKADLEALELPAHWNFLSNRKDHHHIKAVLLSKRKMALTVDNNFVKDLAAFKGVLTAGSPSGINYRAD